MVGSSASNSTRVYDGEEHSALVAAPSPPTDLWSCLIWLLYIKLYEWTHGDQIKSNLYSVQEDTQ